MSPWQMRVSAGALEREAGRLRVAAEHARDVQVSGEPAVRGGGLQHSVEATLDALVEHGTHVEQLLHRMAAQLRTRADVEEERRRLELLAGAGRA